MKSILIPVIEAAIESRISADELSRTAERVAKAGSEVETYVVDCLRSIADFGFVGGDWLTYVDIELLFALKKVCENDRLSPQLISVLDSHLDLAPKMPMGILEKIANEENGWPTALPVALRLSHLRIILQMLIAGRRSVVDLPKIVYCCTEPLTSIEQDFIRLVDGPDYGPLQLNLCRLFNPYDVTICVTIINSVDSYLENLRETQA